MARSLQGDPETGELRIQFPYDEALVQVVRGFPERRWHPAGKYWSVPRSHLGEVAVRLLPLGFEPTEVVQGWIEEGGISVPEEETVAPADETWRVSDLNDRVREALARAFPRPLWLQGEVIGFDRNAHKKHVYFQLADKEEGEDRPRAEVTIVLFASARERIERRLAEAVDPFELRDGLRIRVRVKVDVYARAGSYQVVIEDLDPDFTLGELSRRRERILQEVERQGLLERNLSLPFPVPTLRLGLITSYGSDAYNDFLNEIEQSGFSFAVDVRDCHMQGDQLEPDLLGALSFFAQNAGRYDALAIVRGGGSRMDLMGFDSLPIALAVAQHPLKVVVGIGHHRDRSVLDFLAHSEKTPTAVAAALVELALGHDARLRGHREALVRRSERRLDRARDQLETAWLRIRARHSFLEQELHHLRRRGRDLQAASDRLLERRRRELDWWGRQIAAGARARGSRARDAVNGWARRLPTLARHVLGRAEERLQNRSLKVEMRDPRQILARGYAWLRGPDGRSVRSVADVEAGDEVQARLADGVLDARVEGVAPDETATSGEAEKNSATS